MSFWNTLSQGFQDAFGLGESSSRVQAQINRDWQEQMSNTAYQRAVLDMKKAGINPILAFQQGGAETPGGAQGSPSTNLGSQMLGMASGAIGNAASLIKDLKGIPGMKKEVANLRNLVVNVAKFIK